MALTEEKSNADSLESELKIISYNLQSTDRRAYAYSDTVRKYGSGIIKEIEMRISDLVFEAEKDRKMMQRQEFRNMTVKRIGLLLQHMEEAVFQTDSFRYGLTHNI